MRSVWAGLAAATLTMTTGNARGNEAAPPAQLEPAMLVLTVVPGVVVGIGGAVTTVGAATALGDDDEVRALGDTTCIRCQ